MKVVVFIIVVRYVFSGLLQLLVRRLLTNMHITQNAVQYWAYQLRAKIAIMGSRVIGGGSVRKSILHKMLSLHYREKFRREWELGLEAPHYEDRSMFFYEMGFNDRGCGPYPFYPGFYVTEILKDGDVLLDIGCGDGFLTRRFYAEPCAHIDAIDIDPLAIHTALKTNADPRIQYHLCDITVTPFPRAHYDVVVWDGAIGHFSPSNVQDILGRIRNSLTPGGIFVGSESLGDEGHDHLQVFDSIDQLRELLSAYFPSVLLQEHKYKLKWAGNYIRHEAFWRCYHNTDRLAKIQWRS